MTLSMKNNDLILKEFECLYSLIKQYVFVAVVRHYIQLIITHIRFINIHGDRVSNTRDTRDTLCCIWDACVSRAVQTA